MDADKVDGLATPPDAVEHVMTLVIAAMSRPAEERDAFIHAACADQAAVLADVRRRVSWEERLGSFLLAPLIPRELIDRPFDTGELVAGRFRIRGVAGEGGMGVVYDAIDEKLVHRVALKCPKFDFRRRLSPEALSALRVTHRNVCRVFAMDTAQTAWGEVDFLTMEYLEGETLASRLLTVPSDWLSTPEGRQIVDQVLAGLRAAHDQQVVHRDLKPTNVMLTRDASGETRAVLMDFGIAQTADIFSSQRHGTPGYLAPEIWEAGAATERSDIYALGVLLHEMETGCRPFPAHADWRQRLHGEPAIGAMPQPWRSIIRRCLATDPDQRFQSVAEIQASLRSNRSRRWLALGAAAASVAALVAVPVKTHYWPTSPVRIAVLPPIVDGDADKAEAYGFAQDLSYRLKTLRGSRRPSLIIGLNESLAEQVHTVSEAGQMLGATHAIVTVFTMRSAARLSVSAALLDTSTGRILDREDGDGAKDALQTQLFGLQSRLVDGTARTLSLRGEPRISTIPAAAYSDYLQGMYYARTEYENAALGIPYLKRVIETAPDSALGYAGLAEAYVNSEYMSRDPSVEAKAIEALAQAEQRDPDSAQVLMLSGILAARQGWLERARVEFRRAIEREPGDAEPYIQLAVAHAKLNELTLATTAFRDATAVNPGYYKPYLEAGVFFVRQGDLAEAERLFLEAVRLAPGQTRARLNLAALYSRQHRYDEQEAETVAALAARRTRDALINMGDIREHQERYEEAVHYYHEAIEVGPRFYQTWSSLGSALKRLGREDEGRRAFHDGLHDTELDLKSNPRDPERIAWAGYYHAQLGDTVSARQLTDQALTMAPEDENVRKRAILALDALDRPTEALNLLENSKPRLREEIVNRNDLSQALRQHQRFVQLVR